MQTWFITGNDTGIGKTAVAGALARWAYLRTPRHIQCVKPVETGVSEQRGEDAPLARDAAKPFADEGPPVEAFTLETFDRPMAPLDAALLEGRTIDADALVQQLLGLPVCDLRLVEGAGGIAVPLWKDGRDWLDFARKIRADRIIMVVENRLGAINQARLAAHYVSSRATEARCGLILNRIRSTAASVCASNQSAFRQMDYPLIAEMHPGSRLEILDECWFGEAMV